jgi:superfamily I DNA and/or RNA helicase
LNPSIDTYIGNNDEVKKNFFKLKQKLYWEVITSSKIICTTSINSHKFIPEEFWKLKSDCIKAVESLCYRVILDEATQSKEPEALIPILGAEQIVLIGDHRQLGPLMDNAFKKAERIFNSDEFVDSMFRRL